MLQRPTPSNVSAATEFFQALFGTTVGPTNVCTLSNDGGRAGSHLTSSNHEALGRFTEAKDRRGHGVYFCVSTLKNEKLIHSKANISEIPSLHADIDFKDLEDFTGTETARADVIRRITLLPLPPSWIIFSGNGLHCYWIFKEPILLDDIGANREAVIGRIEAALRLLADLVGGDMKVTHPASLMRTPGSHNSKHEGQYVEVVAVEQNNRRYELSDLEQMLAEISPILLRKKRPPPQQPHDNAWENNWTLFYKSLGYRPPIDVERRLKAMGYMLDGDNGIHATQLSVSASLLEAGKTEDEIVDILMSATRIASGDYGRNWDWTREENRIRRMCGDWLKKHPRRANPNDDERDAQSSAGNTSSTSSSSFATGAGSSASASGAPAGMGSNSSQKLPLYIEIAKTFLLRMAMGSGELLRQVPDLKGSGNVWKYSGGLWSLSSDQEAIRLLAPILQEIVIAANQEKKSSVKLFNEAARHILRSADVCKGGEVAWDAHGKVPTLDGLIDPITNRLEPFKPEHYATWRLPVRYDPAATCPYFEQLLMDNFAEMTDEDRQTTIQLVQELLGVALIDNKPKSLSRAAVLFGGGDTGKTVLLKIITALFGGSITTTFAKLDGSHGLQSFAQRLPWVLHEAFNQSGWYFSDLVKSLLTGDPVEINPKHSRAITLKVNAPAFWGTNHPPKFKEASGTMATRMIIIPMTRTFDKANPIGVAAEARQLNPAWEPSDLVINTELAGVLSWALVGLKGALQRGYLINTKTGEELLEKSRKDSNSVAGFLEECITYDLTVMTSTADFYAAFEVWWREEHGDRGIVPSRTTVGQDLASISNSRIAQDKAKFRRDTGERFYLGCMLNEAGKSLWHVAWRNVSITGNRVAHMSEELRQTVKPISPETWKETDEYRRIVANTERFKKQAEEARKDRATSDEKVKARF